MKLPVIVGSLSGLSGFTGTGVTYSAVSVQRVPVAGLTFSNQNLLNSFKGGICVNTVLKAYERELLNKTGISNGEWQNLDYKFKDPNGLGKGCVAVYWNKNTWDNGKWKGTVRYEWLYAIGNDIMVTYGLYTSEKDNTKIKWRTLYANINEAKVAWKTWDGKDTKMPKFAFADEEDLGFAPDFSKICSKTLACNGKPHEEQWDEYKWKWKENGNRKGDQKFSEWADNFNETFDDFFNGLNKTGGSKINQEMNRIGTWVAF